MSASVSGTHLIELASEQYGLTYRLGFGGRAVCMLAGSAPPATTASAAIPNFWGYFHGAGASGWSWASGSAADHPVGDGDREAWSWGAGDSATTHGIPRPRRSTTLAAPRASARAEPVPVAGSVRDATVAVPTVGGGSSNDGGSRRRWLERGGTNGAGRPRTGQTSRAHEDPGTVRVSVPRGGRADVRLIPPWSARPPRPRRPRADRRSPASWRSGAIALLGAGGVATMRRRRGAG